MIFLQIVLFNFFLHTGIMAFICVIVLCIKNILFGQSHYVVQANLKFLLLPRLASFSAFPGVGIIGMYHHVAQSIYIYFYFLLDLLCDFNFVNGFQHMFSKCLTSDRA